MSRKEAVVGIYLSNWLSTRYEMKNEMFLAAAGLSCSYDKGNFLYQMYGFTIMLKF